MNKSTSTKQGLISNGMSTPTIKKIAATISEVRDLTETAKEITLTLAEPMPFEAGTFVNFFIERNGEKLRRAFSIASDEAETNKISLAIRHTPDGRLTPLFWEQDVIGMDIEIMGPMGLNPSSHLTKPKAYLFAFGVGAGVIRAMALHLLKQERLTELVIMTGSRHDQDIIYKTEFDALAADPRVTVTYVTSKPSTNPAYPTGYIQDHIAGLDFNESDVYMCGQEVACNALQAKIEETTPQSCVFHIEEFH